MTDEEKAKAAADRAALEKQKQRKALQEEINKLTKEQNKELGLLESARERLLSNQEKQLKILENEIKLGERSLNDAAERESILEKIGVSQEQYKKIQDETLDHQKTMNILLEQARESLEAQKRVSDGLKDSFTGIASKIGITNEGYSKVLKNTGQMITDFNKMGDGKFMENFVGAAADVFSFSNILGSVINKTVEMAMAAYDMGAELQKTTGIAGVFREELSSQVGAATDAGVEFSKLGASYGAITTGLIGATADSTDLRKELGLQMTQFEQFGIQVEDSVDILNTLSTTMNTDMTESMEIMKDLTMSATQLGLGPKKMAEDFKKASASLAVHGKKSVEVFKGLAVAARNAGTDVSSLLSIAGKFDTFESAADTAGKLNSILGSTMSATEMLMMTEDQRIESLIGTVQASGQAFNQMDRFTQKAIAQAAGIQDMSEANRIFGMSLSAYKEQEAEAQKSADAQEKFNKAIDGVLPLMTRLTIELQKLGQNEVMINSIIDGLVFGIETVAVIMEYLANPMGLILALVAALALKMFSAALAGAAYGKGMALAGAGSVAGGKGGRIGAVGIRAMGMAMAHAATAGFPFVGIVLALAVPILALAVAAVAVGYGFKLAFQGLASFIEAFSKLSITQMIGMVISVYALSYGIAALAGSLALMANPFSIGGIAAFLAISAAIYFAADGFAAFAEAARNLDSAFNTIIDKSASFAAAKEGIEAIGPAITKINKAIDGVTDKAAFKATLENIALITTGKSAGITQASEAVADRISNISATLKNDMKILLEIDGKQFSTKIKEVTQGVTGDDPFGESLQ